MDSQLVQRTRYQLQARVRTAKTCPSALLPGAFRHLVKWVDEHPLLRHLLDPVREDIAVQETILRDALASYGTPKIKEVTGPISTETREQAAALGWAAIKVVANLELTDKTLRHSSLLALVLAGYNPRDRLDLAEVVEIFRDAALQPAFEFLDEQIDARNAVLGLLLKYKTRCEWFRRDRLRGAASEGLESRISERALAFDLYEYLHDQGVDFAIESATASGEPDLVASDAGGQALVADAKYIADDGKVRETMAGGFRQVMQYCRDKNETTGYLVVFLNCEVRPEIEGDADDGFPCFRLGGVTVYYVLIDIRERTNTASKLPKPRVVPIKRERLVEMIEVEATEVPTES